MTPSKRAIVIQQIRKIWESLETHLEPGVAPAKKRCVTCGSRRFHADCVVDYAQQILDLAKLLQ